ncbi:MAG: bifunctional 3-phenylpropionate/cinnamic acid dioxygenase ferredoxin subunit [Rhodoferax sp.]|nr:bifunctional 3-phenylpropionate/cinnamic acid dioxygenase ferredoxin subunit [Rhodoferax sp.]
MERQSVTDSSVELRLCRVDAVEEGEALRVEIDGRPPLAVYHVDGEFFVSDDTCSHGEASLAEGSVDGAEVECPWHSGKFCLRTGNAVNFPAVTPIRVYPTIVRDGEVFIKSNQEQS